MKATVLGRLKNTKLPHSKPLLPALEAVANSFHAIREAGDRVDHSIDIFVERQGSLDSQVLGDIEGVAVRDTGVGFNDANYESFNTVDSQYKASIGGKGLGRFLWLKAFNKVEIDSHYRAPGSELILHRVFSFEAADEDTPCMPSVSAQNLPTTTVRLCQFLLPYRAAAPRTSVVIAHRIVEHFLPFFMDPKCPTVRLHDGHLTDLNAYYREHFDAFASRHEFEVNGLAFQLRGFHLYHSIEARHKIVFAADYRGVIQETLERYLPNLSQRLEDDERGTFAYLAFVQSSFLDASVSNERTSFTFPVSPDSADASASLFPGETTLKAIRDAALNSISEDLRPQLEEIIVVKTERIEQYINREAPQYKILAKDLPEFVNTIPPNPSEQIIEMRLHERLAAKQQDLKQEGRRIIQEVATEAGYADYEQRLRDFMDRYNELGVAALAQYVFHRKIILELLAKSLSLDTKTGKYPLEEAVHNLVFPMRTTSDEISFEQQNLWILDERLTYHSFLASDKRLDTVAHLENESASRPDIIIFNQPLVFSDDSQPLASMIVIEFKRPDRTDFRSEDPVSQVFRMVREIRAGKIKDHKGRLVRPANDQIPAYCYIVCDLTPELETKVQDMSAFRTPDNLGYYGFNQSLNAYYEIISYAKLLNDAQKRNRILFDKLNIPW